MASDNCFPDSTSKKCRVPCSLPPSESETATSRPSDDGTYQSIAVVPLVLKLLGSNTGRQSAGGSKDESRIKTGCWAGGLKRKAKIRPRFQSRPETRADSSLRN